ncbi:four-carbon acid sugar kinase family protein [Eubacterium aggregans]|uniref:four-carbon acid sugar kinase family protein n=1 Tax=Eubacterium aggregans TaxID=81409 RepID=UPI0023F331F4|nr:four-carbon acid sugar kinase family protein [Eubacterium aggregans]MDD4692201.1 four-carbon acid sugar kinase family protein [Eubacterium aggregans]
MLKTVIIADDLTGANVTGALLRKNGYSFATFRQGVEIDTSILSQYDAIAVSTDSRGMIPKEAYDVVQETVKRCPPQPGGFYQKRIDSTLRGNIGSEIEALLDILDEQTVAFVCAAYPDVHKLVIGDYLLVEGEVLVRTGVRKDPKCPVTQSSVRGILEKSAHRTIGIITMDTMAKGMEAIRCAVFDYIKRDVRIISFDAVSNDDITAIAQVCTTMHYPFITVDPGPLTLACLSVMRRHQTNKGVFLTIGSVVPIVRQQVAVFEDCFKTHLVKADVLALLDEVQRHEEKQRIFKELEECMKQSDFIGVVTAKEEDDVLDLKQTATDYGCDLESLSKRISNVLAELTASYLDAHTNKIQALYTSGGDITLGVCQALDSLGICAIDEIEPFTLYGKLIGGQYNNLPIVTKGGLAGNKDTLRHAMSYLQIKLAEKE